MTPAWLQDKIARESPDLLALPYVRWTELDGGIRPQARTRIMARVWERGIGLLQCGNCSGISIIGAATNLR
jgi:hypothetical protein